MRVFRGFCLRRRHWGTLIGMFSYLDAGTGSMLVSILGGGLAGIGVFWKMIRAKVTGKPMPIRDTDEDDADDSSHN